MRAAVSKVETDALVRTVKGQSVLGFVFRKDTLTADGRQFVAGDQVPLDLEDHTLRRWLSNKRIVCSEQLAQNRIATHHAAVKAEADAKVQADIEEQARAEAAARAEAEAKAQAEEQARAQAAAKAEAEAKAKAEAEEQARAEAEAKAQAEAEAAAQAAAQPEPEPQAEPSVLDAIQAHLAQREKHPLDADAFAAMVEAVRAGGYKDVISQYHVSPKDLKAIRDALEQG